MPKMPALPGYNINPNQALKQNFHKSQHFGKYKDTCMLSEVARPSSDGSLLVSEGQVPPGPNNHWLFYDKQVLKFEAECSEGPGGKKRDCVIYYHLEDDTMQVVEPKILNSGSYQGVLIHRHRVPQPSKWDTNRACVATINSKASHSSGYFNVAHLNVGNTLQIYGQEFRLTGCDKFTRLLLQKLGATVPENKTRERVSEHPESPATPFAKPPDEKQFLKLDGIVLNFKGYWDDRENDGGLLHKVSVLYYPADDTIEVRFDEGGRLIKRQRLPKGKVAVCLGAPNQMPILNVMPGTQFLRDASPAVGAYRNVDYIRDTDLSIGAAVDVYGRRVVLVSCDLFTQKYYNDRYGIDDFTPLTAPWDETREATKYPPRDHLPPYNGFGTYEDSAANCKSFIMKERQKDMTQFLRKDRQGILSHVLRFKARLKGEPEIRTFVISYFLSDDTVKIHEAFTPNTGYRAGKFLERGPLTKPGQDLVNVDKVPLYYRADDFFVGAEVRANNFQFVLTAADEYALSYMERNCAEFPKSNTKLILDKIRPMLANKYKALAAAMIVNDDHSKGIITAKHFRDILEMLLPEDYLTEHEYITVLRRYSVSEDQPPDHLLRSRVHSLLRRELFKDIDLLRIELAERDRHKTGHLDRNEAWSACRCLPVPLPVELLELVFQRVKMNKEGQVNYEDLIYYLDSENQPANLEIQNEGPVGFMFARPITGSTNEVSYKTFLEELGLEDTHLKEIE